MPRLPVDGKKVIEHRVTFGTKEREILDGAVTAYQINRILTPVVAALSDVSFLLFAGGVLAAYKYIDPDEWATISSGFDTAVTTGAEVVGGLERAYEVGKEKAAQAQEFAEETLDNRSFLQFLFEEGTLVGRASDINWRSFF